MSGDTCDGCGQKFRDNSEIVNVDSANFFLSKEHGFEVELIGGLARYHPHCWEVVKLGRGQ